MTAHDLATERAWAVINSGCALSRLRFANSGCALSRLRFADHPYSLLFVIVGALYERPGFRAEGSGSFDPGENVILALYLLKPFLVDGIAFDLFFEPVEMIEVTFDSPASVVRHGSRVDHERPV